MVDPLRVRTLLDRLATEVEALRRLGARSTGELLADDDLLAAVKYRFIIAIEVCIDVGRHVIASEGLRAPLDYADVLADAHLVDPAIAADLRDTARFRNLLVHNYTKVDDTRVVEILRERVDDLALFRTALARAAGG